ncbi:MAG TPA: TIM barrel protein, partial [Bryobacteraceae bacterium]|nr:TIM barrel protein [Bryobacteraceae bacterium]
MRRREFLAVAAAAPTLAAKPSFGRDRLSAISDEMGRTPEEALAFAQKFALKFLEIRNVPGAKTHYYQLTEPELKTAAKQFSDAGIRISYFNTPYLKILLPGTKPANQKMLNDLAQLQARSDAAYARRTEDLKMGIRAAHLLSVDKLRVFTGWRVEKPESVFAQAADILGEMAELCAREKVQLLVENEAACNVA